MERWTDSSLSRGWARLAVVIHILVDSIMLFLVAGVYTCARVGDQLIMII